MNTLSKRHAVEIFAQRASRLGNRFSSSCPVHFLQKALQQHPRTFLTHQAIHPPCGLCCFTLFRSFSVVVPLIFCLGPLVLGFLCSVYLSCHPLHNLYLFASTTAATYIRVENFRSLHYGFQEHHRQASSGTALLQQARPEAANGHCKSLSLIRITSEDAGAIGVWLQGNLTTQSSSLVHISSFMP